MASVSSGVIRKKYESCKNFREKGFCKYGDRCLFAHGDHELARRGSPTEDKPKVDSKESVKEESIIVQEQTTMDSTKIVDNTVVDTSDLKKIDYKNSTGSCSQASVEANFNDDTQDHGENSTTLSSINEPTHLTPEKTGGKLAGVLAAQS